MASSASIKDLTKAINGFLPTASLPLPAELTQVVDAYLDKHEKYDEGDSDRLQDEVLSIWEKSVREEKPRHAPYLAIIRRLLPALRKPAYLIQWWDILAEPILDNLGQEKGLAKEVWNNAVAILTFDGDGQGEDVVDEGAHRIVARLLDKWVQFSGLLGTEEDTSPSLQEKLTKGLLLAYGKKRPKEFLSALNAVMLKKDDRHRALTLLCEFFQTQPPHLHLVLETPLFENLLSCLWNDTSTTIVTLAVTALTMLLPNIPSSLVPYLPSLFNIYARLLFWDKERTLASEGLEMAPDGDEETTQPAWEKCAYLSDVDGLSIPNLNLMSYFTILYGLYPINFVDYIRKPQRYLRHAAQDMEQHVAKHPSTVEIDVQPSEIQQRSERFRQYHTLHPNFYSLTIESEKTDLSRWIKSEAAEVVAECTSLCVSTKMEMANDTIGSFELNSNGTKEASGNGTDTALFNELAILGRSPSREILAGDWRHSSPIAVGSLDGSRLATMNRRTSQSSHDPSIRDIVCDSPTLPPHLVVSTSHTQLQDMINSNKAIKSGLHQSLANDSVPSLALSHQESIPDRTCSKLSAPVAPAASSTPAENSGENAAQLYRRITLMTNDLRLLTNDLNFERYMKQQHMIHIGELRRRQLKEAATEAETQNLIMANRNLKYRIEEAKRAELQAKKESENRRNLSKKWETDLSAKLKGLREEQKKWTTEGAGLKRDLQAKTEECAKLTKMVKRYETTELKARQDLEAIETYAEEIGCLKAEVNRLIEVEQAYQAKEKETEIRLTEAAQAISRSEGLAMELDAREEELQQAKQLYESEILALNVKLQEALQRGSTGRRSANLSTGSHALGSVEKMLAGSRAKQADLQRQYALLTRKYTVLQTTLLDMTANKPRSSPTTTRTGRDTSGPSDAEVSAIVQGGSVSPASMRSNRGFSDLEALESTSYNVTPPLESLAGTSGSTVVHRPSTPTRSGTPHSGADRSPPERYHGRGGVQNSSRKEKKDKKPSGFRGIRGLG